MKKKYIKDVLPNGGTLYYKQNKITDATYTEVFFPSGSRCDTKPGLAHLTEHMFFNGTEKLTKQDISENMGKFGYFNALTSVTKITFVCDMLNEDFEYYLTFLEDIVNHSQFATDSLEAEKDVVIQEIKRAEDKYSRKNDLLQMYNLYKQDPYKYSTLGTEETVKSITSEDIKQYVSKYFVANNMNAYISSPLPYKKIKKMFVEKFYSKLRIDNSFKKLPLYPYAYKDSNFYSLVQEPIKKAYLTLNFRIERGDTPDDEAYPNQFAMLVLYLRDFATGILKILRHEKHLVYGCDVWRAESVENESLLQFVTECDGKNLNEVLISISQYINNLLVEGFDNKTLERIKKMHHFTMASSEPKVAGYFTQMSNVYRYKRLVSMKKRKQQRLNTTCEDLSNIAKEIFSNNQVSATIFGEFDKEQIMSKVKFKKLFKFKI